VSYRTWRQGYGGVFSQDNSKTQNLPAKHRHEKTATLAFALIIQLSASLFLIRSRHGGVLATNQNAGLPKQSRSTLQFSAGMRGCQSLVCSKIV